MTDIPTPIPTSAFVRQDLVPERPAPVKTTGLVGFLRTRLFNSPTNILITITSALLLWFVAVPALKFLLVDAVWSGRDRNACLAENAGRTVGACWPFVQAKFSQFIYGFYPGPERWRVNLTFILAAILLLPLLIPRLPAKGLKRRAVLPGISRHCVLPVAWRWAGGVRRELDGGTVVGSRQQHPGCGHSRRQRHKSDCGPLLVPLGTLGVWLGTILFYLIWPLTWLRDQIQATGSPVWADFAATTAIVSILLFFWVAAFAAAGAR